MGTLLPGTCAPLSKMLVQSVLLGVIIRLVAFTSSVS